MAWSPGPIVTRRRLGGELKRLRDASGLKLEQVAKQLECSTSKISRLENGKGIPRFRDVRDLLDFYAVPEGEQRTQLLEWSRDGQARTWWQAYADVLPPGLNTYVEYEWDAASIDAYEAHIVHGLLQTRAYARATLQAYWSATSSSTQIERMVDVRMARQEALLPEHGLMFRCLLDESTLYRIVGSPHILHEQLEHLVVVAEADHVDLRILPFAAGIIPGNHQSFSRMAFSDGLEHGLVHVETTDGAEFLTERSAVAEHDEQLSALLASALTEAESVPLIRRAVDRLTKS